MIAKLEEFISNHIIDHILGLHVYTYPATFSKCLDAYIPRPEGFVVSEIVNGDDVRNLSVEIRRSQGRFCLYLVKKINVPSDFVAKQLIKDLRCKQVLYLGLKEARAIAYQLMMCIDCTSIKELLKYRWGEARLLTCTDTRQYLVHQGNSFFIELRFRKAPPRELLMHMETLTKRDPLPLLNFFGYQRFGTKRPITHLIGATILRNLKEVALSMLCEETLAWGKPPKHGYEKRICKRETFALGKELTRFFLQSYQSYLFNKALSLTWLEVLKDFSLDIDESINYLSRQECVLLGRGIELSKLWEPLASCYRLVLELEGIEEKDLNSPHIAKYLIAVKRSCIANAHIMKIEKSTEVIRLHIFLPRGSYVTILLRELRPCSIDDICG